MKVCTQHNSGNSVSPMYTFPILLVKVDFTTHIKEYKEMSILVLCTYIDIKNFVSFIASYCAAYIYMEVIQLFTPNAANTQIV
jgi:hypothetical protein